MVDVVLGLTSVVIAILLVSLYREVAVLAGQASPRTKWPLRGLLPGQPLTRIGALSPSFTGFVLLADATHDAFAASLSLEAVSEDWDAACVLILSGGTRDVAWLRRLPARDRTIVPVSHAVMRSLGPRVMPTALYLRDGAVLDASSDILSPSRVLERFRLVAAPLHQLANPQR